MTYHDPGISIAHDEGDGPKIYAVIGPPGTGKTTFLAKQTELAVERYGPDQVVISSLTRTAAAEIASRVRLPEGAVGTLHAHCYRALGHPKVAFERGVIEQWNRANPSKAVDPIMTREDIKPDDPLASSTVSMLQTIDVLRHRCVPKAQWAIQLAHLHGQWERFKRETGSVDFTDMIELAIERCPIPPKHAAVLVVDEAQDLSELETRLIRSWSRFAKVTILAGDADQWLYEWRGAKPVLFLPGALPDEQVRVLAQSYRVPVLAKARATKIIEQCRNRRPVRYLPTAVEGTVGYTAPFEAPDAIVEMAARHAADPGLGRMMIIAPCGYTVDPVIAALRERGVPFHNPYRVANGKWNPIAPKSGTTAARRVLAFLHFALTAQPWPEEEWKAWVGGLKAEGVLKRGVKAKVAAGEIPPPRTPAELQAILVDPAHLMPILAGDLDWYVERAAGDLAAKLDYPVRIVRRFGRDALLHTPRVIVGTIHSTKGGEAERVVVSPDLSARGLEAWRKEPDTIRRLFYVAMTRTSEHLVLAKAASERMQAGLWSSA